MKSLIIYELVLFRHKKNPPEGGLMFNFCVKINYLTAMDRDSLDLMASSFLGSTNFNIPFS